MILKLTMIFLNQGILIKIVMKLMKKKIIQIYSIEKIGKIEIMKL